MKRFKREADKLGNYYIITINDSDAVLMSNQNNLPCSLSSVYYGDNQGHTHACEQVRYVAHQGVAALNRVSGSKWTELPASPSDLTEKQKEQIRSALNEMFNGIAEDCGITDDQAPSAKAFLEGLVRKQSPNNFVL